MKSIITDKIRRHEVLLPINHKYYFPVILEGQKSGEVENHPFDNFVKNNGFWDFLFIHFFIYLYFFWASLLCIVLEFVTGSFKLQF